MEKNYVALFKKGEYKVGTFSELGKYFIEELNFKKLPTITKDGIVTKKILKKIPNLCYKEEEENFIVWDKNVISYTKIGVPVYVEYFGSYKYTGKKYAFEIPTKDMFDAANKIRSIAVNEACVDLHKDSIEKLKELLGKGKGITYVTYYEMPDIVAACKFGNFDILWSNGIDMYIVGAPDMVIATTIKLHVPEEWISLIIGRGGNKIKDMARKMRVERIQVLPLKKSED